MSRLIVFAVIILSLVILAVQNMAPPISLVILGSTTLTLPLAIWLVGAIAIGAILALVIYGLASVGSPPRRPYRPLGQRIRDYSRDPRDEQADLSRDQSPPPQASNAFTRPPERSSSSPQNAPKNAYDTDWESFKAPQQWDNWGERPDPKTVASQKTSQSAQSKGFFGFKRPPTYSPDVSVNEIESGWEDFNEPPTPARGGSFVADSIDDISEGWDDEYGGDDRAQASDQTRPSPRVYRDGSLYSSDDESPYDRPEDRIPPNIFNDDDDNLGPAQVGPDGVYEADYRVIIPPYKPLNDEEANKEE